jgi:lipopolysaccharide/colanic/teichoic acid biosynthesis glycosyltransferase
MVKRLFDIVASLIALAVLSPVFLAAALAIRLSSPGPIFYRARRAGRGGAPLVMHKFRTMRVGQAPGASAITAGGDRRVFLAGKVLRAMKIDELPQLYDVLRGRMSVVGPRPEDWDIVQNHYAPEHWETLSVRQGMASPGGIYNYTHGERLIGSENPETDYLEKLLPVKLALELYYVRHTSLWYDFRLIGRTVAVVLMIARGRRRFADPPELALIDHWTSAINVAGCCGATPVEATSSPATTH